jgi:hypothetical protein
MTVVLVALTAQPAAGSVTIGQAPPFGLTPPFSACALANYVQRGTGSGPDYRVPPGGGVITHWAMVPGSLFTTSSATFEVFARDISGNQLTLLAATPVTPLTPGTLNSIPVRIPVGGGERIGLFANSFIDDCIAFSTGISGDEVVVANAPQAVGTAMPYTLSATPSRLSLSATIEADADKDNFGDETQDSCPIDGSIQYPCAAVIDKGPKKKTSSKKARFTFSVPAGAGITFECALDKGDFAPCASGVQFKKLKPRKHTFHVRAKDGAGAVGAEAQYRWRVTG